MITQRTTFIIGAGASVPYGIPAASGLCSEARHLDSRDNIYQLVYYAMGKADTLKSLLDDLKNHPAESIDAFLEHRQHRPEIMRAGKALIAALLGQALKTSYESTPRDDDWLTHILRKLTTDAPRAADFARGNSGVSFVTFNFDSIIEDRLSAGIRAVYAGDIPEHIHDAINAIQVLHVHGRVPTIPSVPLDDASILLHVRGEATYGVHDAWIRWTTEAADQLHLVMDDIDDAFLHEVQTRIQHSTVVCFLGFQYATSNLRKLGIPERLRRDTYQHVFGSAYKMSGADTTATVERFQSEIKLGSHEEKCLAVLDKFYICRS